MGNTIRQVTACTPSKEDSPGPLAAQTDITFLFAFTVKTICGCNPLSTM